MLKRRILSALGASSAMLLILIVMFHFALPDVTTVTMTVETDHADTFRLYYANSQNPFTHIHSIESAAIKPNRKTNIFFQVNNLPVDKLRFDPGNAEGISKIYSLEIHSNFLKPVKYAPEELLNILQPGTQGVSVDKKQNFLQIISSTDDPYLMANKTLYKRNVFLLYGIPLFIAAVVLGYFFRKEKRDSSINRTKTGLSHQKDKPVNSLSGLRGAAIIMVVGEHTCSFLAGLGTGGVWIFMALSGFLLTKPYIKTSNLALSWSFTNKFFWRRLQRIIPIYYLYISVLYLLSLQFDGAMRHFLFLQGDGHLWFIPQLMMFYLIFPGIMAVNHIFFRGNSYLISLFLLLAVIGLNMFFTRDVFSFYGMNYIHYRFYLGTFLSGILFAYLYYGIYEKSILSPKWKKRLEKTCSIIGPIIFLVFLFGFSEKNWGGGWKVLTRDYHNWFGFIAGLLIFCLIVSRKGWLSRVLSWKPLQAIGVVSFSLYLIHTIILRILAGGAAYYMNGYVLSGFFLYASTLFVGYFAAKFLYTHIENTA